MERQTLHIHDNYGHNRKHKNYIIEETRKTTSEIKRMIKEGN